MHFIYEDDDDDKKNHIIISQILDIWQETLNKKEHHKQHSKQRFKEIEKKERNKCNQLI